MGVINYSRTGDIIEITIRSFTGAKIESLSCNAQDRKRYSSIIKYLKDKYGFSPEIDVVDSINEAAPVNWWD